MQASNTVRIPQSLLWLKYCEIIWDARNSGLWLKGACCLWGKQKWEPLEKNVNSGRDWKKICIMKDSKNIVWRWKTGDCLYNFKGTLEIIFMKGQERKIHLFIQEAILNKTGNCNSTRGQHQVWMSCFNHFLQAGSGVREGWPCRWLVPQGVTLIVRASLKNQAPVQAKS